MSKYMETKAQIEALQAQLEQQRLEELDVEVADIKKRVIAFGITPEMIFSADDLHAYKPVRSPRVRREKREAKYALNIDGSRRTWSGVGERPRWFVKALRNGVTEAQMLIKQEVKQ